MTTFRIPNSTWLQSAMLVRSEMKSLTDKKAAYFTTADMKYVTTELGASLCINPLPQFTRSADIKRRGRSVYGIGLGRYFSETYDDNYQIVHFRFGVSAFNSLALFIAGFYSPGVGALAKTGRAPGLLYRIGQVAGNVVSFMNWKLLAARAIGFIFDIFAGKTISRYVSLKPAMPLYWNSVQTMVNQVAVNLGIVPRMLGGTPPKGQPDIKYEYDQNAMNHLRAMAPGIMTESGSLDVFAFANRAQRMARNQIKAAEAEFMKSDAVRNFNAAVERLSTQTVEDSPHHANYGAYLNRWLGTSISQWDSTPDKAANVVEDVKAIGKSDDPTLKQFFEAELDDGSAFANFRVNYTGAVSESWSNTTGESETASKMNSVTARARDAYFSLAGGNVIPGVTEVVKGVMDVAMGAADGLGLGGIVAGFTGATNVDIPLMWKDSNVTLPRANYTMSLVIPYNNKVAQLLYIYVPLFMVLAGVMPLSTGRNSFTSPFVCEFYDPGRMQTRYGMIDSATVTRGGATNQGFTSDKHALSYEVSFTVADLSTIMHMPIAMGVGFSSVLDGDLVRGFFDDDTIFTDYMAVISAMGVADQIYTSRKLKLALTRAMVKWDTWTSPARWMNWAGDTVFGRAASVFYAGVPY